MKSQLKSETRSSSKRAIRSGKPDKRVASKGVRSATPRRPRPKDRAPPALFDRWMTEAVPSAEKIRIIRKGLSASLLNDMAGYLNLSKGELFSIVRTPESTAHKLIKEDRLLDAGASERVIRVIEIARMANEVFGGSELGARWLKTPNFALNGETPLSMLDTEPGALLVRQILNAIDYGGAV